MSSPANSSLGKAFAETDTAETIALVASTYCNDYFLALCNDTDLGIFKDEGVRKIAFPHTLLDDALAELIELTPGAVRL